MPKGFLSVLRELCVQTSHFFTLAHVQIGKLLTKVFHLGQIVHPDVWAVEMMCEVVLMVAFSFVKTGQADHLRHDWPLEYFGLIELSDVSLRDPFLLFVCDKDGRSILGAFVRSLPVQLRGIVRDREKYFQKLAIRNLGGIVDDSDRFGMPGETAAHDFILSRGPRAA